MAKKIVRLTESDLNRIVKRVIKESYWDNIFGKPKAKDAAHSTIKSKGFSHMGRDDEKQQYIL